MGIRKTILIVDDAAMFRDLESLFLARSGRILTAASGKEGLLLARCHRPDLILADAFMPGMDGEALCRAVRADPDLAATRVLVLTSSERAEDRARALRAGADDVLAKPLSRIELVEAVQRFLRFPQVRGLPRVPFRARVRMDDGSTDWLTTARNLSRGGIFVESEKEIEPRREVTLAFALPESGAPVEPTAEVVWLDRSEGGTRGMGLRFLGLDGRSARFIEEWVRERAALPAAGGVR
jgi:uncharacterized protein (TIGR02266 family)